MTETDKKKTNIADGKTVITRAYLANAITKKYGFSMLEATNILKYFLDEITNNLIKHQEIKITNFGAFIVKRKKERMGRNPRTKVESIISERNVVLFKQSSALKNKLRNYKQQISDDGSI